MNLVVKDVNKDLTVGPDEVLIKMKAVGTNPTRSRLDLDQTKIQEFVVLMFTTGHMAEELVSVLTNQWSSDMKVPVKLSKPDVTSKMSFPVMLYLSSQVILWQMMNLRNLEGII